MSVFISVITVFVMIIPPVVVALVAEGTRGSERRNYIKKCSRVSAYAIFVVLLFDVLFDSSPTADGIEWVYLVALIEACVFGFYGRRSKHEVARDNIRRVA